MLKLLSLKTYKLNFCEVVNYSHDVIIEADMDFNEVIRCRYSCKRFDPERRLSREQLGAILEAGRLAPTAKNVLNIAVLNLSRRSVGCSATAAATTDTGG